MSRVEVVLYMDENGKVPFLEWFENLSKDSARARCLAHLKLLEEKGHELDRPQAAILRDKVYELRVVDERVDYRILYFFHERKAVVVSHGFVKKQRKVPDKEIERALKRRGSFLRDPAKHSSGLGA